MISSSILLACIDAYNYHPKPNYFVKPRLLLQSKKCAVSDVRPSCSCQPVIARASAPVTYALLRRAMYVASYGYEDVRFSAMVRAQ